MGAIVNGGARYLTSAGNPSAIEDAKNTIYQAIYGLLLVLASWVIVFIINPDILVPKRPNMPWKPVGYTPVAKDPLAMCASSMGDPKYGCTCADSENGATVKGKSPLPPHIIETSITPCSTKVPVGTSSLTVTFSEPMDSSTIIDTNFASLGGMFLFTVLPDVTKTKAVLTLVSPLTSPGLYEIGIKKDIKSAGGINLASDFILKFSTDNTSPDACAFLPTGNGCSRVCSDPNFADDGKYHCMKAELRLSKEAVTNDSNWSDSIIIAPSEKFYIDARSGSADYAYPGLTIGSGVSSLDDKFDNGVDAYLFKYNKLGTDKWYEDLFDSRNSFGFWDGANAGQYDTTACTALGDIGHAVMGDLLGLKAGIYEATPIPFNDIGDYQIVLNIRSKNGCMGPAVDIGHVYVRKKK